MKNKKKIKKERPKVIKKPKKEKVRSLKFSLLKIFLIIFVIFQALIAFYIVLDASFNTLKSIKVAEENLLQINKKMIRDYCLNAYSIIDRIYSDFKLEEKKLIQNGSDSYMIERIEEDYKVRAINIIKYFKYNDDNGYFWITDTTSPIPMVILEPLSPELVNTNPEGDQFNTVKDTNQNVFEAMSELCLKDNEGYIQHKWVKPLKDGVETDKDKISFGKIYYNWKWIIGTGFYLDEVKTNTKLVRDEAVRQVVNLSLVIIPGSIVFLIFVVFLLNFYLSRLLVKPLKEIIDKSQIVARGDLTVRFLAGRKDEIGDLINSFSNMVDTLKNLNQKIYIAIIILTKNLRQLFRSSNSVKDSANTQAVTLEETQRNFENMNLMVETIAKESSKANDYTSQALKKANIGMESMQKLESEMLKIENSSLEITNIIGMINEIAEQTNLLSLNASIESARAGEAGKGFSIVAGEIRKLAEKSTHAANRIQELIGNNNKIIQEGVKYSKNTTGILKDIAMSNELIAGLVRTISDEIQKMKVSSQEILSAINHISDIAQDNLGDSEKVSQAMTDFVEQTLELQKFVGQFDVRPESVKENQSHIEEILRAKLIEVNKILAEYGSQFLPTGNVVKIGGNSVQELQIGNLIVTGNVELVDGISKKTNTSVTIFQTIDDALIRVATTVRNFDDTRAIGTIITKESKVFQTVMTGRVYFGRAFVVNKWYVAVYKPIVDETGYILGAIYLGIPEEMQSGDGSTTENKFLTADDTDGVVKDETFRHNF